MVEVSYDKNAYDVGADKTQQTNQVDGKTAPQLVGAFYLLKIRLGSRSYSENRLFLAILPTQFKIVRESCKSRISITTRATGEREPFQG